MRNLVYLDPPFCTGHQQVGSRSRTESPAAYNDRWPTVADYLAFMRPRVELMARVLLPSGSILLHCDWRTCHHFRLMLDGVFGTDRFVNHLIWSYGLGGSSPRGFARKHDDILFYAKSDTHYFSPPMVPATSHRMKGLLKKATDVIEIPSINNMSAERTGYPTQKPLALLSMLVEACSPPGGLVIDPFCGSGTTLVAAATLGRDWLGIDANPEAVGVANRRIAEVLSTQPPTALPSATCAG